MQPSSTLPWLSGTQGGAPAQSPATPAGGGAPAPSATPDFSKFTPTQLTQYAGQFIQSARAQKVSDEDSMNFLQSKGITQGPSGVAQYQDPVEAAQLATAQQAEAQQPSLVGGMIRGIVRPVVQGGMNVMEGAKAIGDAVSGHPDDPNAPAPIAPQTGFTQYLENGTDKPLQRLGANFDPAQGFTPQNMQAIQEAVQAGVDVAGLMAGGAGVSEEGASLADKAIGGAKVGGTLGAIGGATSAMTPGTSVGQTILNTVKGGAEGALGGAVAEPALGAIRGGTEPAANAGEGAIVKGGPDALNEQAVQANKIINPDNVVRQADIDKLSDVNQAGDINSTTKGRTALTRSTVLKPEVMAQDPNNAMVRELMDKGVVDTKNTHIANIGAVKGEIQDEAGNLKSFLSQPHNDIPVKYSDLETNINKEYQKFMKDNDIEPGSAEDRKAQGIKSKYLKEIANAYKAQPVESAGTASGTKSGIESFNNKMESQLGDQIYKDTPEGRTQIKMAQLARKSGYDTIQKSLNDFDNQSLESNKFGKQAAPLLERAKTFNNRQGFIDQMLSEGSNSNAEQVLANREGRANAGTARSTVSESGLNVNDRSTLSGGTHGAGYSTTPSEDLGEIYDMAHEGINSTKGDAFKASLQRQAKLYQLRDEMMSRTGVNTPQSAIAKFMNSPKGYAARRIARVLGPAAGLAWGATELENR